MFQKGRVGLRCVFFGTWCEVTLNVSCFKDLRRDALFLLCFIFAFWRFDHSELNWLAYIVKKLIDTEIHMSVSELERVFGVIMFTL